MVQIRCECGYVARDASEETVIGLIQEHLRLDHPELARTVGVNDIRGWLEVV